MNPSLASDLLEVVRASLEKRIGSLEALLVLWTAIVVLGLLYEYLYEFADLIHPYRGFKALEKIGAILVVIGVVGEMYVEFAVSPVQERLRTLNDGTIAGLIEQGGKANERARSAEERARSIQLQLAKTGERIALAEKATADANAKTEVERLARVKIEQELAWRILSAEQEAKIRAEIPPALIGLRIGMSNVAGDPEGARYAADLSEALHKAGLIIDGPNASMFTGILPEGVIMMVGTKENTSAAILQRALGAAGIEAPGQLVPGMVYGSISLLVGVKPHPRTAGKKQ